MSSVRVYVVVSYFGTKHKKGEPLGGTPEIGNAWIARCLSAVSCDTVRTPDQRVVRARPL
eukprot:4424269-Alexandrium_andersonii.AAC.1